MSRPGLLTDTAKDLFVIEECFDNLRIPEAAGTVLQSGFHHLKWRTLPIGSVTCHRIVCDNDGQNPCKQGNVRSRKTVRVSSAVERFVMMQDTGQHILQCTHVV